MQSPNRAIVAAAGSGKTSRVVNEAAGVTAARALIVTYTNENQRLLGERLRDRVPSGQPVPEVLGWFTFLINECARPYQVAMLGRIGAIRGLYFKAMPIKAKGYPNKTQARYYINANGELYRDDVAALVVELDRLTDGAVIRRLERIYSHIFVDEMQDLSGFDLDVVELLMRSSIEVTLVGDPRQAVYSTTQNRKNTRFKGKGIVEWLNKRPSLVTMEELRVSFRCNQQICDFADGIYPKMPSTTSANDEVTGHDGIFMIGASSVDAYVAEHAPAILRYDKNTDTGGHRAMNIGVAKGSEFDRVLVFGSGPMRDHVRTDGGSPCGTPDRLYVAATRARFSVAFVV